MGMIKDVGWQAGGWLLNTKGTSTGFRAMFDQPLSWFGFNKMGEGANAAWSFGGVRTGGPAGLGRHYVPDFQGGKATGTGSWGSRQQYLASFKQAKSPTLARMKSFGGRVGGPLLAGLFGAVTYNEFRSQGHGVINSAVRATGKMALEAIKWRIGAAIVTNPLGVAAAIGVGAIAFHMWNQKRKEGIGKAVRQSEFLNESFAMNTEAAYTMRQRSLKAINRSQINARMALGGEARFQHLRSAYPNSLGGQ